MTKYAYQAMVYFRISVPPRSVRDQTAPQQHKPQRWLFLQYILEAFRPVPKEDAGGLHRRKCHSSTHTIRRSPHMSANLHISHRGPWQGPLTSSSCISVHPHIPHCWLLNNLLLEPTPIGLLLALSFTLSSCSDWPDIHLISHIANRFLSFQPLQHWPESETDTPKMQAACSSGMLEHTSTAFYLNNNCHKNLKIYKNMLMFTAGVTRCQPCTTYFDQ